RACPNPPANRAGRDVGAPSPQAARSLQQRHATSPPSPGATPMSDALPRTVSRPLQFANGSAIGISNRWNKGQYCVILTQAGLVGCRIYDLKTAAEFGQAVAIARGTPQNPLVEPEDLFEARIVDVTPQALALGVQVGMTGREAVERLLAASKPG